MDVPYPVTPRADVFRVQIGTASPPAEVCDRRGAASTVCKYSRTGCAFILAPPGISATTTAPIDLTSVSDTTFLHFATGDFFSVGSWPP